MGGAQLSGRRGGGRSQGEASAEILIPRGEMAGGRAPRALSSEHLSFCLAELLFKNAKLFDSSSLKRLLEWKQC